MGLKEYHKKRDFKKTPEPKGRRKRASSELSFVVQKHHASHLHYDFRLELGGVLKSWAVPKGPSLDPSVKRLAVEVEDHPLDYASFEGWIPEKQYGAGEVIVWDRGTWTPPEQPQKALEKGRLEFTLSGEKLKGRWLLLRTRAESKTKQWLLIKRHDDEARPESEYNIIEAEPGSVLSSRRLSHKIERVEPQLATLAARAPTGSEWVHEIKFDGYRTMACLENGKITIWSRSGHNWTKKYPQRLSREFSQIKATDFLIDGEVSYVDEKGRSDFALLQKALKEQRSERLVFYAFDLLHLNGRDLRSLPLTERKKLLARLLKANSHPMILYSEHFKEIGSELLKQACHHGLEGVVSKRADQGYVSGRSPGWIKAKCANREEFVVGGYSKTGGTRQGFGALLVGSYDVHGQLIYKGRVGTGYDSSDLRSISQQLKKLQSPTCPFETKPRSSDVHWVKPQLVVEVEYRGWSADRVLRHASFKGLREDKPASEVQVEPRTKTASKRRRSSMPELTHPDKILYPKAGITKAQIAEYYRVVGPRMLPYVKMRPLALLRCPHGAGAPCFFQKHLETEARGLFIENLKTPKGVENIVAIESQEGLISLTQMGALELHGWQTVTARMESPDQFILDLDPDEAVSWARVQKAAFDLRDLLEELELKSFVKLTGGKGVHIHVPIAPGYSWPLVKSFSQMVSMALSRRYPQQFTTQSLKARRKGKIFLDYLRNGYGATAVLPYSLRANERASVALPLSWKELKGVKDPGQWTLPLVQARLSQSPSDPWLGYLHTHPKVTLLESGEFQRAVADALKP